MHGMQEVTGSIPVISTSKEKHCTGMCSVFLLCLPSYAAAKFMLDICGKLWYNSFCNCGYSTSASISAFQAEEVGSIPIARSMQKRRWFVKNQRLSLSSGTTFGPTSDFERQKALAKSKKKEPGGCLPAASRLLFFLAQSQMCSVRYAFHSDSASARAFS